MKKRRLLKNFWTKSIGSGLVLYLLTSLITALSKKINFLQGMGRVLSAIWNAIYLFLTFSVSMWILLIVAILIIFIAKITRWMKKEGEKAVQNSYLSYRKDYIKNWLVVWSWDEIYGPENIVPICENCGCLLSHGRSRWFKSSIAHFVNCLY